MDATIFLIYLHFLILMGPAMVIGAKILWDSHQEDKARHRLGHLPDVEVEEEVKEFQAA